MTEKSKKPRLRFKGFTEAWEQRELDELLIRISTGLNPRENFVLNSGGKNYYVTIKNFEHGHLYLDDNCDKVDDEALKLIQQRSDLRKDDILFTSIGRVGDCYLIENTPNNWNINESVFTLRPNKSYILPLYLFHTIHIDKVLSQILSNITGSTFKSIKISDLKKAIIPVTSFDEQDKISHSISVIDNLITLHQRKYDKFVAIKKALLEKMFPRAGKSVPEIRFKGFTETWEQCKVKDVANRYDNLRIPVAANLRVSGRTPYYGANGIQDYVDGFTHEGEFVLVAEDGANDLKNYPVNLVKGRIWVNNHAHVLQTMPKMANNAFLAYSINQSDIESLLVGGGRAKLNAETLMNIEMPFPALSEQEIIGEFLVSIDNLITLHQRQLEKLKNIKSALLEKMFV